MRSIIGQLPSQDSSSQMMASVKSPPVEGQDRDRKIPHQITKDQTSDQVQQFANVRIYRLLGNF